MDELLMLDAIERYHKGEMNESEKAFFDDLRKSNPEVDQLAVEHGFFLHELDKYSAAKAFRQALHETESKMADEGLLAKPDLKGSAKLVQMWKKYKRIVAVAASIAGIISIISATMVIAFGNKFVNKDYTELSRQLNETNKKVSKIDEKVSSRPKPEFTNPPKVATAFMLDARGYFVTNYHVTSAMKKVIYVENNRGEYFQAVAVYNDRESDLAILKITDTSFRFTAPIPYGIRKSAADLGEKIFTLGYPRNEIVYSEGYLSAKSGNEGDSSAYQFNVSVNHGNSGGPVLNNNGEVIAIITAKNEDADGVTYAAKAKNIYSLIEDLKKSDTTFKAVKTPSGTALKGLDRVQQIKKLEDFVFMVVGN